VLQLDTEESVKYMLILTLIAGVTLWSCTTAPEDTGQPEESRPAAEETAQTAEEQTEVEPPKSEVTEEADDDQEEASEPEPRLDKVISYLSNGVLDTIKQKVYRDGLLVEELETYADGSPAGKITYTYQDGLMVSSLETDRTGKVLSSFSYKYDEAGNVAEETLLDTSGKPIFTYRFSYGPNSRRSLLEILSGAGLVLSYAEYTYTNGRNHRVETFSLLGELQEYLERSFNEAGLPVSEVIINVDGEELEKVLYEYNGDLLVKRETFVNTRKISSTRYEYDEAGYITIRERYDRTGKLIETIEYIYTEVEA
jgi:antitoxin component YwqK of YwqJK toxin-antitoxin module